MCISCNKSTHQERKEAERKYIWQVAGPCMFSAVPSHHISSRYIFFVSTGPYLSPNKTLFRVFYGP